MLEASQRRRRRGQQMIGRRVQPRLGIGTTTEEESVDSRYVAIGEEHQEGQEGAGDDVAVWQKVRSTATPPETSGSLNNGD